MQENETHLCYSGKTAGSRISDDEFPKVSLIMPIRNEAGFITKSLSAVLNQDYPQERMEIVIVDGMSEDGTREMVDQILQQREAQGSLLPKVHVLDNPDRIVPCSMNRGIRRSTGDVIVRVDGHAIVDHNYVRMCVESLLKTGVDCVGGAVTSVGIGYVGKAIAAAMGSRFGVGGSGFRVAAGGSQSTLTDTVPFGAYRREVFVRVGLFNEKMVRHQDYEFNYRVRRSGGKILLLPSIRAEYVVRSKLSGLWRQYWQYGIWKGRFLRAYPDSLKLRHLVPAVFVLAVLFGCFLGFVLPSWSWVLFTILGSYSIYLLIAVFQLSFGRNIVYAPILPVIFLFLHISYGLGIWVGICTPKDLQTSSGNRLSD